MLSSSLAKSPLERLMASLIAVADCVACISRLKQERHNKTNFCVAGVDMQSDKPFHISTPTLRGIKNILCCSLS